MNPSHSRNSSRALKLMLGLLDFALLNVAFFLVQYWKRGYFDLLPLYEKLLVAFYVIWLIVSFTTKKFSFSQYQGLGHGLWKLGRSGLYFAYASAIVVVLMGLYKLSRTQIFGTCVLFLVFECLLFTGIYAVWKKSKRNAVKWDVSLKNHAKVSYFLLVSDFVLLWVSFFIINYLKRAGFHLLVDYEKLLLLTYGLWFVCSIATRKFEHLPYANFYHAFWPWIKTAALMGFSMAMVLFFFRLLHFSRTQAFGPIILLLGFESAFFYVYFQRKTDQKKNGDVETIERRDTFTKQNPLPLIRDHEVLQKEFLAPVRNRLCKEYLKEHPELFELMDRSIDLKSILRAETSMANCDISGNFDSTDEQYTRLLVNLEKINNARYLNRYFLRVYSRLVSEGWFVGYAHTISTHRKWIQRKYPRMIANGLYGLDFMLNRVFPKLPALKQLYFAITDGKNRVLSRAEVLGRLSFCGFEVVEVKEINERFYFVCRKAKVSSYDLNPSYGPLVELKRVGFSREIIKIYKFRTMHPYSEYLQDYVYRQQGLMMDGDKFQDDFRNTEWGKVMRALWLDELPMLYNLVRGDIKLVGVRPLSIQKFETYDTYLQELRTKYKPGLVPPKYADLPKTRDEFMASEERYLKAYEKNPGITDIKYFFKAVFNIAFRGARSG